jgi:hypothetical protein
MRRQSGVEIIGAVGMPGIAGIGVGFGGAGQAERVVPAAGVADDLHHGHHALVEEFGE